MREVPRADEGGGRAAEPGQLAPVMLAGVAGGLVAGGVLALLGLAEASRWTWDATTAVALAWITVGSIARLARGELGVDLVAAVAMAGALALGEHLAGVIVAFMLTTGAALERLAIRRARRELTALLARAPRIAHRRVGEATEDVAVDAVAVGDRLLVKTGEVVPADGRCLGPGIVDPSALTGEARPAPLDAGDPVASGVTNQGPPLELRVTAPPAESTYAGIVRLVHAASTTKAPFVRLADRYAAAFLGLTAAVAGAAGLASGDPVRALAVLVVATPCPLLLAAPAAIVAGVSHAARHGIVVKGGGALEALARVEVVLLDKTGTVTAARPRVVDVRPFGELDADELVRLAASVERLSIHPFAEAILAEARDRGVAPAEASGVVEAQGTGVSATVDGRRVSVGQRAWVGDGAPDGPDARAVALRTRVEGSSAAWVSVDGRLAGALILADPIRADAPRTLQALRRMGIRRIELVTGDHPDVADLVGDAVGADRVFAGRTPADKAEVVDVVRREGVTAMVGDGVNDAPALALADVGVAMGARGATAASEAADVVLTSDRLHGLAVAVRIARRTRAIALQSVLVGMGLSIAAMGAAAVGLLPPVAGAILQEGIDVLVLLNALRALGGGVPAAAPSAVALGGRLADAHRALRPRVEEISAVASRLASLPPEAARDELLGVRDLLEREILPHEAQEQDEAYPVVQRLLPGEDPVGPLVRTHQVIRRMARTFGRMVAEVPPTGPRAADLLPLVGTLYGLHAVLSLHFDQEDELYSVLDAR